MGTELVSATAPTCSSVNQSPDRDMKIGTATTETGILNVSLHFVFLSSTSGFIFDADKSVGEITSKNKNNNIALF